MIGPPVNPVPVTIFVTVPLVNVGLFAIEVPPVVAFQSIYWAERLPAEPVVFAALFGISVLTSNGSWACGNVPVVKSLAETTTFELNACPFTVVLVDTLFVKSVVKLVT